jgi:hypothetical protein
MRVDALMGDAAGIRRTWHLAWRDARCCIGMAWLDDGKIALGSEHDCMVYLSLSLSGEKEVEGRECTTVECAHVQRSAYFIGRQSSRRECDFFYYY